MIHFESDYTEGCHPKILEHLIATNMEQTSGYGEDKYCLAAAKKIKSLCKSDNVEVHFLVGGTQANLTVISSILKPYQGVISATTGHINVHEAGAIEVTGHKVLTIPSDDGKIYAEQIKSVYDAHYGENGAEHCVQPGMVYISLPTENGTIYTKSELEAISSACRDCKLPLFIDGARLGYALGAEDCNIELADVASLCDVFYIGGTKVGALFGEAVVIMNPLYQKDFRYHIKQRGGLLAKGRLLGIQFDTLFTDGLYFDISKSAVRLALKIKDTFLSKGYKLLYNSSTNQQFPILRKKDIDTLSKKYVFSPWCKVGDDSYAVRFCTSWATSEDNVNELINDIELL